MSFQEEQTDAVEILVSEMGPHVCNYSRYMFEQGSKMLGEEANARNMSCKTRPEQAVEGAGAGCFPVTWGTGKTHGSLWHSSLFAFLLLKTQSQGAKLWLTNVWSSLFQ